MSILDEAKAIIHGQREEEYGHPKDNIKRIAGLWSVVLGHEVTLDQVLQCMVQLKISRWMQGYKRDTIVDLAGYAALAERIRDTGEATPELITSTALSALSLMGWEVARDKLGVTAPTESVMIHMLKTQLPLCRKLLEGR